MPFYFIDMELCDLDLGTYIEAPWKTRLNETLMGYLPDERDKLLPILGLLQIREIMKDITRAIVFIHLENEVHRDLKPPNGK